MKRLLLFGIPAIIIVFLAYVAYDTFTHGSVTLNKVPSDAYVAIDGGTPAQSTSLKMGTGSHTLTFTRDGFAAEKVSINVASRSKQTVRVTMAINSPVGTAYMKSHPGEGIKAEGIAGQDFDQQSQNTTAQNPIVSKLPVHFDHYSIGYGASKLHPNDPNAIAIYITTDAVSYRAAALAWIKAAGYDPSKMEIIYN